MPYETPKDKGKGTEMSKEDDGKTWEAPLNSLRAQHRLIRSPNIKDPGYVRQKANKKLWVRERIAALLDPDSFQEVGSITGQPVVDEKTGEIVSFTPANSVTGFGRVRSRRVFVVADDFSVRGGHADGGIFMKAPYGETLALKNRIPLIRMLDGSSGGGSVALYLKIGATYIPGLAGLGKGMDALSVVPIASALLGPVVGLAAAKTAISHFSVMVKGLSQYFAAGPPIVQQATFETLTKEELGGWEIHATNGSVDNTASDELDAFAQIRAFLSYLPSSIYEAPPSFSSTDAPSRREEELVSIIPRRRARPYDIRKLIRLIVDKDGVAYTGTYGGESAETETSSSFFEIGRTWGRSIVIGFARLNGKPVGVLSSDCTVNGGAIDALGSQKTTRFVNICSHFSVPILNLVDQPGFAVGSLAERSSTIRHGTATIAALYQATMPMYTVLIRRVFGVAGGAFADPDDGFNNRVAWPSGDWGSLPLEGGIEAAYKRQLDGAKSPEEREAIMKGLLDKFEHVRSPLKTAHMFGVEEIIDPRDTRPLVCEWIDHVYQHLLPSLIAQKQSSVQQKPVVFKL